MGLMSPSSNGSAWVVALTPLLKSGCSAYLMSRLTGLAATLIPMGLIPAALLSVVMPAAMAQSLMDQAIYSRCSAAMAADFQQAGKTPAPGLVEQTCNCVVKQINTTHNIDLAKTICSKQAKNQSGS